MPVEKWSEVSRQQVFRKYGRGIDEVRFQLPGNKIEKYYIKSEPPAVCVLPLTETKEIILIKQFRPGPQQILLELPGGYIEPNEDKTTSIARELLEETGHTGNLEFVTTCYDDAYSNLIRHCFVAQNCKPISGYTPEDNTSIERVSIIEFRNLLRTGKLTDVEAGYLALDYLHLL